MGSHSRAIAPPFPSAAATEADDPPPRAEVIPPSPPPEALAAVAEAARAYEAIRRSGRHISLGFDARGRLRAELQDPHGRTIRRLSAVDVLRAAEGAGVA